ncbi:MAG: hypothetical protein WCA36_17910, partial [Pseudolabrys sp.]
GIALTHNDLLMTGRRGGAGRLSGVTRELGHAGVVLILATQLTASGALDYAGFNRSEEAGR